jgi:plastocyanin/cytochrome c556
VLAAVQLAGSASAQEVGPATAVMGELAKAMRAIHEAIDSAPEQVAQQARVIQQQDQLIVDLAAGRPEATDFVWHAQAMQDAAAALLAAAAAAEPALQLDAVRALKATCTACHMQFRPPAARAVDPHWPSEGGIVMGRVQVRTLAGEAREGVDDVVAFVDGLPAEPAPAGKRATIVQRDRAFVPELLVVTAGTTVDFPNHDAVFHNVFSLSKTQPFDHGLYGRGQTASTRFTQPGLVKIYCNIHPEMVAHVLVLNNPHAVRLTPGGFYCLSGLPAGRLTLRTWSELGADASVTVEVGTDVPVALDLSLQERGKRTQHRNKFGRSYREKY